MKLNASKTKTMKVSKSRIMIDGTVLKESDDIDILRVIFD